VSGFSFKIRICKYEESNRVLKGQLDKFKE